MAQINVTQFAQQLGLPTTLLIEQLQAAGVDKALSEDTALTEKDKTQLLEHLRKAHGAAEAKQKITLTRRQTTEIKKSDSTGKSRTIQIEVRKKRVLVKREAPEPETPAEPPKPVLDAEQIALRVADAKRQAELAARQAEDAEMKRRKKESTEAVAEAKAAEEAQPPTEAQAAAQPPVEGTLHKPTVKPRKKRRRRKRKPRSSRSRKWCGRTKRSSDAASRRAATRPAGWAGARARRGPDMRATRKKERRSAHSPYPASRWCGTSWCRKRSPLPTSRTRCR